MKKVLILAYDFPPYVSVGGLRPHNWFKYFKNFDVEPVVITRQWDNKYGNHLDYIAPSNLDQMIIETSELGTIIRTPYKPNLANKLHLKYGENKFKIIRKSISLFFEITQFIWVSGPKKELFYAADDYIKKNKIDVIIATGDPFVLFHFASKLSEKYDIPWIADYRDPWSFGLGMTNVFLKSWNRFLEKKTIKNAVFITTVNNTFVKNIKTITHKNIHLLPNGYDPEIIEELITGTPKNTVFTISFIGTIYKWNPVELFFKVLNNFVAINGANSVILNFYGINNPEEIDFFIINKYPNLKEVVKVTPRLPNEEVLLLASKSHLLLLFNYYSIIGTKIYDYIGLKIPILFCFSNDKKALKLREKYYKTTDYDGMALNIQQKVINEKNAGFIVKDTKHLLEVLNNCLQEFKETGTIKSTTKDSEEFSRKNQTGKLAELIKQIAQ